MYDNGSLLTLQNMTALQVNSWLNTAFLFIELTNYCQKLDIAISLAQLKFKSSPLDPFWLYTDSKKHPFKFDNVN